MMTNQLDLSDPLIAYVLELMHVNQISTFFIRVGNFQ